MRKKRISMIIAVGLLLILAAGGCQPQEAKTVVALDWTPNTNHTGLYVALENGYFADEGLEVEIIQPATGTAEQLVASGQAQYGVSSQEAVTMARLEGIPVVSIAAIIQNNTSGFASLKTKGIETPADFEGMRYGGWGSPIEEATIKALMTRYGADYSKVEILTTGAVDFLTTSEYHADFSWIFYGWDGIAAEIRGIELNYINIADYHPALNYYTPVLMSSEDMIANQPEDVSGFMRAVTKGYEYAMMYPEEAAAILLKHAPELDEELVVASQEWLADKYQADAAIWGEQKLSVWQDYFTWLTENELIEGTTEMAEAFTTDFLAR
jgi:ABC-type nitrate/sulfonate/bicarbonate transport system substrate-binding protein